MYSTAASFFILMKIRRPDMKDESWKHLQPERVFFLQKNNFYYGQREKELLISCLTGMYNSEYIYNYNKTRLAAGMGIIKIWDKNMRQQNWKLSIIFFKQFEFINFFL